jgi:hypothetical protein
LAHLEEIDFTGTHRLIPEKYSNEQVVLETLRLPEHVLSDLNELDGATSEWKRAEAGRSAGLGPHELVFGVPEAAIVNASFTHPGPEGARFSSAKRGAWYAGLKFDTSVAEVAFHRRRFLQNVRNEKFHGRQAFSYVDFLADFRGKFHHLDPDEQRSCSQAEPIPACYRAPQRLAEKLLFEGSLGIVYQSVRHSSGTCIACFRPALVLNPRRDARCRISLDTGSDSIEVSAHSTAAPV